MILSGNSTALHRVVHRFGLHRKVDAIATAGDIKVCHACKVLNTQQQNHLTFVQDGSGIEDGVARKRYVLRLRIGFFWWRVSGERMVVCFMIFFCSESCRNEAFSGACSNRVGLDAVVEIELADDPASFAIPLRSNGVNRPPRGGPATRAGEIDWLPVLGSEGRVHEG